MSEGALRVGLVGYGVIGIYHLDLWSKVTGAEVVAVCDVVPERAQEAAAKFGSEAYYDYGDMLARAKLDAVDICTPSGMHAEQGILAAERGLHVLTEKPMDIDLAKADRLIESTERAKVKLACIFQYRVGPEARLAKQLIDDGKLGRLLSCSAYVKWWRDQSYYDSGAWRGTWALDGGVLSNQAVHSVDQLCYFCGPVKEAEYAYVTTTARKIEAEDFAIAVLAFENGAKGVVEATTCAYPGVTTRTEIIGEKGSASLEGPTVTSFKVLGEEIDIASETAKVDGRADARDIGLTGHAFQLQDFVDAIREDRRPFVTGRDARLAVDALTKIYRKAGAPRLGT
ncbi:MAG: Gfo/Idh/MocA family oxidoreductase [Armatimonadota bacterium]|nr:Gfo/Idh/MocA family oxidoreductase [Armatimonadota bacterium]